MGKRLLGHDSDGVAYYLADASWDCGWYWGYGYIQTRDSHQHADGEYIADNAAGSGKIYNSDTNIFTGDFLTDKTFSDKDGWILRELFATFYQLKKQAELVGRGGMHVTTNPLADMLKDEKEAERINKVMLPRLFEEINKILDKQKEV